jgi:hypothetical protein
MVLSEKLIARISNVESKILFDEYYTVTRIAPCGARMIDLLCVSTL